MRELFLAAFGAGSTEARPAICDTGDIPGSALDELSLDDARAYQEKTTKWIKNCLRCVQDEDFWSLMGVARATREPWLHYYRILNKQHEPGDMPIVTLVSKRLVEIRGEFTALLQTFFDWARPQIGLQRGSSSLTESIRDVSLLLLLHGAASFDRRIVTPFSRLGQMPFCSCVVYNSDRLPVSRTLCFWNLSCPNFKPGSSTQ